MQRDLVEAIKQYPLRQFKKGEAILQAGQPADTLYVIRQGFAKVDSISRNGNQQLIWIASRYDIIPTESLFRARGELHFYYTALTDLDAFEIPKKDFLGMCENDIKVIREIALSMSAHYDDLLIRLRSVEQSSIREKLIYTLHYIATRFSSESVVHLNDLGLQFNHQDIGQMIGATRETTAIELKRLKDEGFINYSRSDFTIYTDKLAKFL
ncbi:MAG: Crp/Fnr family transcriptional regulator [Candidatus Saccharimonadales bacterium]